MVVNCLLLHGSCKNILFRALHYHPTGSNPYMWLNNIIIYIYISIAFKLSEEQAPWHLSGTSISSPDSGAKSHEIQKSTRRTQQKLLTDWKQLQRDESCNSPCHRIRTAYQGMTRWTCNFHVFYMSQGAKTTVQFVFDSGSKFQATRFPLTTWTTAGFGRCRELFPARHWCLTWQEKLECKLWQIGKWSKAL